MTILPKAIYRFNPYQTANDFFHRFRTKKFTICTETQKTPNSQNNFEKEKWRWRNQAPWLQTIQQSYSNQNSMVLAQKQKYRSLAQVSLEINPHTYGHLIYDKGGKNTQWRGASRWQKSKMWRSPSLHKYIRNTSTCGTTPTEHLLNAARWTQNSQKARNSPTYLGRAKEKRKNRDKRIGMGPAPVGGSCEGGKVSTN